MNEYMSHIFSETKQYSTIKTVCLIYKNIIIKILSVDSSQTLIQVDNKIILTPTEIINIVTVPPVP